MNISEMIKKYWSETEVIELGFTEEITEDNFYIPLQSDYIDCEEETEEWDIAKEKPGLWENIRKKKERMGDNYRPAKVGDKDRPDPKSFKKAQATDMAIDQLMKMKDQLIEIETKIKTMSVLNMEEIEFEEWTLDMVSKSEIYIQNIYDFVKYYEKDDDDDYNTESSEYQGRKVTLNKPFRTPDGPKKFSVYVKNEKGNVVKVNFGDPNMKIKKDIPERRKSFRARHNCESPGPKWKARYWSCKMW